MGVFHFDNPKSEQDLYKELRQRKTQWTRAQSSVNKADAERATAIAQLYPNFSPDVITSLTKLLVLVHGFLSIYRNELYFVRVVYGLIYSECNCNRADRKSVV